MKKISILFLLIFTAQNLFAQSDIKSSESFIVTGKVKTEKTFTLSDLQKFPSLNFEDINTSCSPRREEKAKSVKVVLLKNVLDSVAFDYERPKMLNCFYFLFVAADGYKMVFSFNEVYNTDTGNNLFIVTEMDGKPVQELENRILILSTKDIKGGSRNMKWLSKIVVGSVE